MNQFIYLKDVVTLKLAEENCVGCGMCVIVCPHDVFSMNKECAKIKNKDACMECGACAQNCATNALSVQTGVGCAAAVINTALGRDGVDCCVIETQDDHSTTQNVGCC